MVSEKVWEAGLNQTQALALSPPLNSQLQSMHNCMSKKNMFAIRGWIIHYPAIADEDIRYSHVFCYLYPTGF